LIEEYSAGEGAMRIVGVRLVSLGGSLAEEQVGVAEGVHLDAPSLLSGRPAGEDGRGVEEGGRVRLRTREDASVVAGRRSTGGRILQEEA
jgi:hypothetical protein